MLELVLLRHPETEWNRLKRLQGQSDIPPLEATVPDELVRAVLDLGFVVAVYSSDLRRCAEPALDLYRKITSQISVPALYCETDLLRERSFGQLEGKSYQELGCESFSSMGEHLYSLSNIPEGEYLDEVRLRASKALQHIVIYQEHDMRTVIPVFTHGCFMNYLLTELEGNSGLSPYRSSGNLTGFRVRMKGLDVKDILPFPR